MDIFLRALRIPSFRLSSETHQWNVVYYNDKWYHLDATWDDPVTHNGSDILTHTYFLITTEELHILDDSDAHVYSTVYADFIE
jgi:transglutaminase/protease-like cytokinesis protein 3